MSNKKKELDDLKALSEKDLWCTDLDEFITVWNDRLKEDGDIQKKIRGMGRRVSQKIGAGRGGKMQSRLKVDDDYAPKAAKGAPKPKPQIKVDPVKSSDKFKKMFAPKPKSSNPSAFGSDGAEELSDAVSDDDDFAALTVPLKGSRSASEAPSMVGRSKRAAAAKPKNWLVDDDESESDDDKMLGDIGDMVKGIGAGDSTAANGRLSLFGMSRPESSSGRPSSATGLPKAKAKAKVIDLSDEDDQTNYEMLARSSPHKPAPTNNGTLDSFLSDDDDDIPVTKKAPAPRPKPAPKPKKAPIPKKTIASASAAAPKPISLSPAAKAYALKQTKMKLKPEIQKALLSEDEDDDIVMSDADSPAPKPAARGRPARAAVVAPKKKPVYVDSDDDMELDEDESAMVPEDDESEDFDDDE